jgi:hypothetical protein
MDLWVPAKFWDDHSDRCPADNPETDMCDEVRRAGARVLVRGTAKQVECLRSDAAFYCDRDGPDECPPGLVRSAKATLDAIKRALQVRG